MINNRLKGTIIFIVLFLALSSTLWASQVAVVSIPSRTYDFMGNFGAACNNQTFSNGMTNGTTTFKDTTDSPFTSADTGKTIFIVGGGSLISAPGTPTITQGGTGGLTGYSYTVTAITPVGETTAPVAGSISTGNSTLSSSNYNIISWTAVTGAIGYNIYRTVSGGTPSSTGKVVTGITAFSFWDQGFAASGSVPGSNTAYGNLQTTITYSSATTVTLATAASSSLSTLQFSYGNDDSMALGTALSTINTAGGGVLQLPNSICLIAGQITFPNSGNATYPEQSNMRITGTMASMNGVPTYTAVPNPPTSGFNMLWPGPQVSPTAKMLTTGLGNLELDHFSIVDYGSDLVPLLKTTNTTITVHDMFFQGCGLGGKTSENDAIFLGGTVASNCNTSNCAFQGYGTDIRKNYFDKIRTMITTGPAANGIVIRDNEGSGMNGNNAPGPQSAMIQIVGVSGDSSYSNTITGNAVSLAGATNNYNYAVYLNYALWNYIYSNDFDDTNNILGCVYFDQYADNNVIMQACSGKPLAAGYGAAYGNNTAFDFGSSTNNWIFPGSPIFTTGGNYNPFVFANAINFTGQVSATDTSSLEFGLGGRLNSTAYGGSSLLGGMHYNGSNWISDSTQATSYGSYWFAAGDLVMTADSGLTGGNPFTPTVHLMIEPGGVTALGGTITSAAGAGAAIVTSAQNTTLQGNVTEKGITITSQGTKPAASTNGSGGSCSTANGDTDESGIITCSGASGASTTVTLTFNQTHSVAPVCIINLVGTTLEGYMSTRSSTAPVFTITSTTNPVINYICR